MRWLDDDNLDDGALGKEVPDECSVGDARVRVLREKRGLMRLQIESREARVRDEPEADVVCAGDVDDCVCACSVRWVMGRRGADVRSTAQCVV